MSPTTTKASARQGGGGGKSGRAELDYLRNGKSQALARFSKEHAARIMAWAIRLGPPEIDPQDVAKQVFSTVLTQLDQQPDKIPSKVWIYRLTKKQILQSSRKQGQGNRWLPWKRTKTETRTQTDSEDNPRRKAVQLVLQTLPMPEREALVLVDMEDFSLAEAAMLMGTRNNEVAQLLQKARTRFAREATKQKLQPPSRTNASSRKRR